MAIPQSWLGGVLALVYLLVAGYITQDEVRHSHGGWINLRGFGTNVVTAPSQLLLGPLLKAFKVPKVTYAHLGWLSYGQLVLHILVTATMLYFLGAGVHWLGRHALQRL